LFIKLEIRQCSDLDSLVDEQIRNSSFHSGLPTEW